MKKVIISYLLGFTMCLCVCIITIFYTNRKIQKEEQYYDLENNNLISMMIQNESGEYEKANQSNWPTDGYNFNKTLSKCENGSKLSWRNDKVVVNTTTSDKCYVYFDLANGTEQFPYQIDSIEDLVRLSKEVAEGDTKAGMTYVLTRDLDFQDPSSYEDSSSTTFGDINGNEEDEPLITELTTGRGFKSIGFFYGILNGGNNRIDNLFINTEINGYAAFISVLINGEVKNLTISGETTSYNGHDVGGIVAAMENSKIENCVSEVNVTSNGPYFNVGGIVGLVAGQNDSIIKDCVNKGNITGGGTSGGIVGGNSSSTSTLTIKNCSNEGIINNNTGQHTGGIIGSSIGSSSDEASNLKIEGCHNNGKVKSETAYLVGGILGYGNGNGNITINNTYNAGEITINSKTDFGNVSIAGIIGNINITNDLSITNSYNKGIIKNEDIVNKFTHMGGALGLSSARNTIIENFHNDNVIDGGNNGNRVGGIAGAISNGNNIINKCYNTADIYGDYGVGGLIGHGSGKIFLLNSYNIGNVNGNTPEVSGLIARQSPGYYSTVINSYNVGNVISKNIRANGILEILGGAYLNNVYNAGKLSEKETYGIGYKASQISLQSYNIYYANGVTAGSNIENIGTNYDEKYIKSTSFTEELNNNLVNDTTIKEGSVDKPLMDIDPSLEGYTLSQWKLGDDGYPTLVNN